MLHPRQHRHSTTGMLPIVLLVLACPSWAHASDFINLTKYFGDSPRKHLNFMEMVKFDNITVAEVHNVRTSDGYDIEIYRVMPNARCPKNATRLPMLFVHGLFLSADDCVIPGPGKAHCYIYSDACYEVWVMNCRGNKYSRRHKTLNPDKDMKYWNFGLEELALKDLPAVIDYILKKTGKEQLIYIGHSQGIAILLILCSTYTEYNAKLYVVFAMSPSTWLYHARLFVLPIQGILSPALTALSLLGTHAEVLNYGGFVQKVAEFVCGHSTLSYPACSLALFAIFGYNKWQLENQTIIDAVCHEPAGTSLKIFNWWGQIWKHGFKRYDYGPKNMEMYGTLHAPEYELHKVRVRMYIPHSANDYVCELRDLATMVSKLVNSEISGCRLFDDHFGHVDYIYGKSLKVNCADFFLSILEGGFECNGKEGLPSVNDP